MIKNIVFDMGNVLLRYDPFVSLNKYCRDEKAKALIYKELFCGEEWVKGDLGIMNSEERFESVRKRIPDKYSEELKKCVFGWDMCMLPLDGAKEFLDCVKSRGFGVYLLSNAGQDFYSYFPRQYDIDFFDGYVVSSDIGIIKPDRRIYDFFLKKYNLKAEECFFIDDMAVNIDGAKAVGMNGAVFKNDYREIKEILDIE